MQCTVQVHGAQIILPALLAAFFLPEGVNEWLLYIIFAFVGTGLSIAFLLPWRFASPLSGTQTHTAQIALFY